MNMPKIGDPPVQIEGFGGAVAFLKKIERNTWHLRKQGAANHSRFGNMREIMSDIEHFKLCGSLPRSSNGF